MINPYIFWILFIIIGISCIFVVLHEDLLKSALFLAVVLFGTAFLYIVFQFDFLAWVQILLYVGGVVVLILFVIMLAKQLKNSAQGVVGKSLTLPHRRKWLAGMVSILTFLFLIWVIQTSSFDEVKEFTQNPVMDLPENLFGPSNILSFEVLSLLLIAALIGAFVMARRE